MTHAHVEPLDIIFMFLYLLSYETASARAHRKRLGETGSAKRGETESERQNQNSKRREMTSQGGTVQFLRQESDL